MLLSRIGNIFYGVDPKKVTLNGNWEGVENETDQKIRLIAKIILWAAIGAIMSLLPGFFIVGKPGLYSNITILGQEVWEN